MYTFVIEHLELNLEQCSVQLDKHHKAHTDNNRIAVTEDLYLGNNRTIRRLNAGAPQLIRQTNAIPGFELDDNDFQLLILQHTMSGFADTPYLSEKKISDLEEKVKILIMNRSYSLI